MNDEITSGFGNIFDGTWKITDTQVAPPDPKTNFSAFAEMWLKQNSGTIPMTDVVWSAVWYRWYMWPLPKDPLGNEN